VYIPKNRKLPLPGVLFTLGLGEKGKYHKYPGCVGVAKKGYVALVMDPIGQGERQEYFDPKTLELTVSGSVNQHHYVGRQAFLTDWSLSTIRTWDCLRAVDYLASRAGGGYLPDSRNR
jgi:cephalosporin-C deacetylase-like acetyl esterase